MTTTPNEASIVDSHDKSSGREPTLAPPSFEDMQEFFHLHQKWQQ